MEAVWGKVLFACNNQLPIWTILILSESIEIVSAVLVQLVDGICLKAHVWIILIVTNLHVSKWQSVVEN